MRPLKFLNNNLTIFDRYHNLIGIFQRKIIEQFFTNVDYTFALAPDMKTASTSFLSHYYEIMLRYINNWVFIRNRKIYMEVIPILSYESYGEC